MSPEIALATLKFLDRVTLSGKETIAFNTCVASLQQIALMGQKPSDQVNDESDDDTPPE